MTWATLKSRSDETKLDNSHNLDQRLYRCNDLVANGRMDFNAMKHILSAAALVIVATTASAKEPECRFFQRLLHNCEGGGINDGKSRGLRDDRGGVSFFKKADAPADNGSRSGASGHKGDTGAVNPAGPAGADGKDAKHHGKKHGKKHGHKGKHKPKVEKEEVSEEKAARQKAARERYFENKEPQTPEEKAAKQKASKERYFENKKKHKGKHHGHKGKKHHNRNASHHNKKGGNDGRGGKKRDPNRR